MKILGSIPFLRLTLAAMLATSFGVPGACAMCCQTETVEVVVSEAHSCCSTETEPASHGHESDSCCSEDVAAIATPLAQQQAEDCAACAHCSDTDRESAPLAPVAPYQAPSESISLGPVSFVVPNVPESPCVIVAQGSRISPSLNVLHCVYLR